jgi:hypothetical protein
MVEEEDDPLVPLAGMGLGGKAFKLEELVEGGGGTEYDPLFPAAPGLAPENAEERPASECGASVETLPTLRESGGCKGVIPDGMGGAGGMPPPTLLVLTGVTLAALGFDELSRPVALLAEAPVVEDGEALAEAVEGVLVDAPAVAVADVLGFDFAPNTGVGEYVLRSVVFLWQHSPHPVPVRAIPAQTIPIRLNKGFLPIGIPFPCRDETPRA